MEEYTAKDLQEDIRRGDEAKAIATHPGFHQLMDQLEEEKNAASQALHTVDPYDSKQIQKLQNVIWRYEELVDRLSVFISNGKLAANELLGM